MKFVFLLTVWTSASPVPQVNVEDYNLTGEDCIARMVAYVEAGHDLEGGAIPSCEIQYEDQPAPFGF